MPEIIKEAKTIEAAIDLAIKELGCSKEDVITEILQEPVKGIFGMAKMARVKVTFDDTGISDIEYKTDDFNREKVVISKEKLQEASNIGQDVMKQVLNHMGIPNFKIKVLEEEDTVSLDIYCDSEGLLIGRHGQTLASLQYLINRIIHHSNDENKKVRYIVDVGGYKVRHKSILEKMAKRVAQKVLETKEEEQLQAMSAYDRRIIHLCIKDNPDVSTYSLGEGNFRRVVIAPKEKSTHKDS